MTKSTPFEMSFKYRIAIIKFSCSNHKFRIETGRHNNIDHKLRIYIYCFQEIKENIVECEFHVLCHCQKFDQLRNVLLFDRYVGDTNIDDLYTLLHTDNPDVIKKLSYFINMVIQT